MQNQCTESYIKCIFPRLQTALMRTCVMRSGSDELPKKQKYDLKLIFINILRVINMNGERVSFMYILIEIWIRYFGELIISENLAQEKTNSKICQLFHHLRELKIYFCARWFINKNIASRGSSLWKWSNTRCKIPSSLRTKGLEDSEKRRIKKL